MTSILKRKNRNEENILAGFSTHMFFTFIASLTSYIFVNPSLKIFVGFENYKSAFSDPYLWNSLFVKIKFVTCVESLKEYITRF